MLGGVAWFGCGGGLGVLTGLYGDTRCGAFTFRTGGLGLLDGAAFFVSCSFKDFITLFNKI